MSTVQTIWILPRRIHSAETEAIADGKRRRLSDVLDVNALPMEVILGIPEEVVEKAPSDDPIFSQLCRDAVEGRDLFTLSIVCGTDESGRPAYLTLVEFITPGGAPALSVPVEGLPEQERSAAMRLQRRLARADDIWVKSIKRMLLKASRSGYRTLANVMLVRAAFPPEWTPARGRGILIGVLLLAAILLVLLALLSSQYLPK